MRGAVTSLGELEGLYVCRRLPSGQFLVWWGLYQRNASPLESALTEAAAREWGGVWGVVLDDRSAEHWTAVPDEVCRIFFLHPGGFRSRGVSLLRPRCEACGDLVELVCGGPCSVFAVCLLERGHAPIGVGDHFPVCRGCLETSLLGEPDASEVPHG